MLFLDVGSLFTGSTDKLDRWKNILYGCFAIKRKDISTCFFFFPLKNGEDNIKIFISAKFIIFEFRTYFIIMTD